MQGGPVIAEVEHKKGFRVGREKGGIQTTVGRGKSCLGESHDMIEEKEKSTYLKGKKKTKRVNQKATTKGLGKKSNNQTAAICTRKYERGKGKGVRNGRLEKEKKDPHPNN